MKLCKDCAHISGSMGYAFCNHPNAPRSVIDGSAVGECHSLRGIGECGMAAKWFEERIIEPPRKTWFARIFGE